MELTNGEIKNLKKLKDKKYRKEQGLFLVEGKKSCEELLNSNFEIKMTFSSNLEYSNYPNFSKIDFNLLESIATTESPQDIICVAKIPKKQDCLPKSNSLILDNLQDPGNIGTLIRSAVAFNFNDIYFINCADIFSEKVIRSSMGAVFHITSHFITADYLIENKHKICDSLIGTDLVSKGKIQDIQNQKLAVVIGNEGKGISKQILENCDVRITLKMTNKVESLNAGVAGSIVMYEIFKPQII